MTITVVFDPPLPSDSPATFNTKAFSTLGDLNDWSTEANALAGTVNSDASTASTGASTATTQAGIATTKASEASASALAADASADAAAASAASVVAIEVTTHAATSKTTPVDADEIPMSDSAASWGLKKLTWANLKATAKTYLDTLYLGISATAANASQLLGGTWASPGSIGSTTPAAGAFTTLAATDLTTTGNTVLGNATTDTLNIGNGGIVKDSSGLVSLSTGGANGPAVGLTVNQGIQAQGTSPQFQWYAPAAGSGLKYQRLVSNGAGGIALQRVNDAYSSATAILGVDAANNVLVVSPAGLGYGAGAGGTVTQATSKSTAVTLNKPTGQITMNSAALAANTAVSFALNNSLITTSDLVLVCFRYTGQAGGSYQVFIDSISLGTCSITLKNLTAGSLSDGVVITFAVIKGALA